MVFTFIWMILRIYFEATVFSLPFWKGQSKKECPGHLKSSWYICLGGTYYFFCQKKALSGKTSDPFRYIYIKKEKIKPFLTGLFSLSQYIQLGLRHFDSVKSLE